MIIVVSLFTTGATVYWYQSKIESDTYMLKEELEAITARLSQSLAKPVWDIDFDILQNTLIAEMQNKNIATISIHYDSSNTIMLSKGRDLTWKIISLNQAVPKTEYKHTLPVLYKSRHVATVSVQLTDHFLKKNILESALGQLRFILFVVLFFIIALSITLFYSVIRPIKSLALSIDSDSESKFNSLKYQNKNDEIGHLARRFQAMRHNIQEKISSLNREIVERSQIEARLKSSESKYRTFFESTKDTIFLIEPSGIITDSNSTAISMFGIKNKNELIGKSPVDLSPMLQPNGESSHALINTYFAKVLSEGTHYFEWTHIRNNSSEFECSIILSRIELEGKTTIQASIRDISEFTKTKEALQTSDEIYRTLFERSDNAVFLVNPLTGLLTDANSAAEQLTARSVEELKTLTIQDVSPKDAVDRLKKAIGTSAPIDMGEVEFIQPDGSKRTALLSTTAISDTLLIEIARDITERKNSQELLVQNEKMLSVGGLAAGMAHEINNPLGGIIQNTINLENRLTNKTLSGNIIAAKAFNIDLDALQHYINKRGIDRMISSIKEAGGRAAHIVSNMLSFARKTDDEFELHDMASLLDRTLVLASTDYDIKKSYDFKTINIIKEYEATTPQVQCEEVKIQQVLLNILRNGAEAMYEHFSQLAPSDLDTPSPTFIIRLKNIVDLDVVQIEIEDNGPGISEEVRSRIFEPFYTTKAVGVGTGLGLSVSYFIISENHNGEMFVDSEPESGSTFVIRLPITHLNGQ